MGQISATSSPANAANGTAAMAGSLLSGDGTMLGAGDPLTSPFSGLLGSLMADLGSSASLTGAGAAGGAASDASQTGTDSQQGVLAQFLTSTSKTAAVLPDAGASGMADPAATIPAATGGPMAAATIPPTQGPVPPLPTTTAPLDGQSAIDAAAQQAALSLALPSQGQAAPTIPAATGDDSGNPATATDNAAAAPDGDGATDLAQQAAAQAALAAMMPLPQPQPPSPPPGTATGIADAATGSAIQGQGMGGQTIGGQAMGPQSAGLMAMGQPTPGSAGTAAGGPVISGGSASQNAASQNAIPQPTAAGQATSAATGGFALPAGLVPAQDSPSPADATALNALAAAAVKNPPATGAASPGTTATAAPVATPVSATPAKGGTNGDGASPLPQGSVGKAATTPAPAAPSPAASQSAPSITTTVAATAAAVPVGRIGAAATAGSKVAVGGIGANGAVQGAAGTGATATVGATAGTGAAAISGQSITDQGDSGSATQDGESETEQGSHDTQASALLDTLAGRSTHGAASTDAARFLMPGQTAEAAQAASGGAAQSLLSGQQVASGVDLSKSYIGGQGRMAQYPPTLMQVSMNLQKAVQSGADTVTVQLKPDDLGSINVRLSFEKDGRVKANITADNVKTLDMLQRNSGDLQKNLQSAGIKADSDSLSFSLQDDGQSGQQQQQARPQKTATVLFNMDDQSPDLTPIPETAIAANGRLDVRI